MFYYIAFTKQDCQPKPVIRAGNRGRNTSPLADPERIGIIGICGWGGMALNAAALDTRIKATATSTMYDMTRVNAKGYFDSEDSADARYEKRPALRTIFCGGRTFYFSINFFRFSY